MTATVVEAPTSQPPAGPVQRSPLAARRAIARWAWRLFRREWRQQILVLALVVVAVAATIVGAAAASDAPAPAGAGFGTAQDAFTVQGPDPRVVSQIAVLEKRFGKVDVITDQTQAVPGSVSTYQVRAQNPQGAFGAPMLARVQGRYPADAAEVAVTAGVAQGFGLHVGSQWHVADATRHVVGIVENPQSLLDEFALVTPGQVTAATQTTILFDAPSASVEPPRDGSRHPTSLASSLGGTIQTRADATNANTLNPETISLAGLTIGMILIALVAVGGFTVVAQRRLRALGMLAALGATDKQVAKVVRGNGVVVGVAGALMGVVLGFLLWLAYRPHLEASSHHRIGPLALPWTVVVLAMVLAVVATYFGAARPARAVRRVPVVAALSGRPAPPKQVHRSAVPGIVFFAVAFVLLGYSNASGGSQPRTPELVFGLVALIPGVILLSPFFLSVLARLGRRTPIATRLALRDLARYRARSGSALAAISVGIMVAMIITIIAAARYGNVLDYAGPNMASNQLILYTPDAIDGGGAGPSAPSASQLAVMDAGAHRIAATLGTSDIAELDTTSASLDRVGTDGGRNWNGTVYVATPALLHMFGITASAFDARADVLTMRPGVSTISGLQLRYGGSQSVTQVGPDGKSTPSTVTVPYASCAPCGANRSVVHPVIEEVGALPAGTQAPNTVVTEHAVHQLGLELTNNGWLIQTSAPLTASQITVAQQAAAPAGLTVNTKNDQPTSGEVVNWATLFGIALALAVLAMSVGLIRSETASNLRTLTAAGASSLARRALTASTAGGLALLGAVLGTLAAYVGVIGWIRSSSLNGGVSALGKVPVPNLLAILIGMPLLAAAVAWLLAGREPSAIAHQPIE